MAEWFYSAEKALTWLIRLHDLKGEGTAELNERMFETNKEQFEPIEQLPAALGGQGLGLLPASAQLSLPPKFYPHRT